MSVFLLPIGKRYSICENGIRRTCAVTQITTPLTPKYLIEMARPDKWSISTLLLTPKKAISVKVIEEEVRSLLEAVVNKGGHWDRFALNMCENLDIEKIKHYQSDDIDAWAQRIMRKIF